MWALVIVLNGTKQLIHRFLLKSAFSELNWVMFHLLYQQQALSHSSITEYSALLLWLLDLMYQVISKSIHELSHVL